VRLNRWVLSLRPLLLDLTNQLIAQVGERHPLLIVVPERLPPILADKDKLRQVLLNLLNNAVKYSPEGGEVTLSAEVAHRLPPEHPPGRFVLISVRDQGMGIAREDLPRIFDRFYRVDNSNTRRIGGTGLGLAITKALVELHGGRIWAESNVGQGSVFSFTLPIANQPTHQLPRPTP
jgi:signal transduction histidine kinase